MYAYFVVPCLLFFWGWVAWWRGTQNLQSYTSPDTCHENKFDFVVQCIIKPNKPLLHYNNSVPNIPSRRRDNRFFNKSSAACLQVCFLVNLNDICFLNCACSFSHCKYLFTRKSDTLSCSSIFFAKLE